MIDFETTYPREWVKVCTVNGDDYTVDIEHWQELKTKLREYHESGKTQNQVIELADEYKSHMLVMEKIECIIRVGLDQLISDHNDAIELERIKKIVSGGYE